MLDRIIAHTPLGQEQLLFRSLDGIEALSTPFDFSIELLSTDARLDRKALLGQPLTLEIDSGLSQRPTLPERQDHRHRRQQRRDRRHPLRGV